MARGWILGLDLGTSGLRGVVPDTSGTQYASAETRLAAQTPEAWRAALETVLDELKPLLPRVGHIIAAATSSTVMLWRDGPLAPALMYDDGRGAEAYTAIRDHLPPQSGAHGATSTLSKVRWLMAHAT